MIEEYEVGIIGGGPAGYTVAIKLAEQGKRVIVFETDKVGGTCLHRGCIPMKSLLYNIEDKDVARSVEHASIAVERLYKGLMNQIQNAGIRVVSRFCKILERTTEAVILSTQESEYVVSDLVIATGSRQRIPNIAGIMECISEGYVLLTDDVLKATRWGKKVAVIGGGVTGLEMASYLSKQSVEVTVFEMSDGVLNNSVDEDILSVYHKGLKGITILCDAIVSEVDGNTVIYEIAGKFDEKEFDQIIIASGRQGNIDNLGIEDIGIETANGFIVVDNQCKTNLDGIYACGDVIGQDMLAHVAYIEAEVVASNILGVARQMTNRAVPKVVYTDPEFATVGVSERELIKGGFKNGTNYFVYKSPMTFSSRYVIMEGLSAGICKLIFDKDDILVGAQIIGNGAGELIGWVADMIVNNDSRDKISKKIYPHPSICEILRETVK